MDPPRPDPILHSPQQTLNKPFFHDYFFLNFFPSQSQICRVLMKLFDSLKESFGVISLALYNSIITRKKARYRIVPCIASSLCPHFFSGTSVAHCRMPSSDTELHIKSQSCEHQPSDNYWKNEFPVEMGEEEIARHIRRAISKANNGIVEDVIHALQHDESCCRLQLTPHLVDGLLHKFGDDWKSALGLFRWADSRSGFEHSSYARDKMVDLLGKLKQMDLMWGLLNEMSTQGLVTLGTIAKVMRRLAGCGRWKEAIRVFDDLESMGLDKNTESMNLLLDSLCKEKKPEVAREVYLNHKARISPSEHTFNIFVHGWCNARRIDEAMWTIQEMKGSGFYPSVITYSTILQAHCNQLNFPKVYELLDTMVADGCPPNVVTYTIIINSLAKSQEIEQVMSIVERMKSSWCKPDTLFYNSLINILGRAGQLHEATRIFKVEMQMDGVSRNLSTYNTMISVLCYHHKEQDALDVLKEMEKSSCMPVLQTYNPLLKLFFTAGKLDQVNSLLSNMVNIHHLSFDIDTYTLLIHGLCSLGKIDSAWHLFDEMTGREILPRTRTCKMLIFELEEKKMDVAAERIKSLMKQMITSRRVLEF